MFSHHKINKKNLITGLLIAMILYFSFFFLFGRYGFVKYTQLKRESSAKSAELSVIQKENAQTSSKIKSMKSSSIDKDLLDEQVRENLGYMGKDEKVIYFK